MDQIVNSWWMYLLGVVVLLVVLIGSVFFIVRSYQDAKRINMDTKILKKTIINSALFTILPSISILIGVITLSGTLGVPLPWIRLTVIGALHYEGVAAKSAYKDIALSTMTPEMFVTIACVMTIGILSGPLYCLIGFKSYDKKVLSKAKNQVSEENNENETQVSNEQKEKKTSFGTVLFNAVFIAMVSSFLAVDISKIISGKSTPVETYVPSLVIIASFGSMAIFDLLEKKLNQKWLASFSLGLSMIIGMAVAIIFG